MPLYGKVHIYISISIYTYIQNTFLYTVFFKIIIIQRDIKTYYTLRPSQCTPNVGTQKCIIKILNVCKYQCLQDVYLVKQTRIQTYFVKIWQHRNAVHIRYGYVVNCGHGSKDWNHAKKISIL